MMKKGFFSCGSFFLLRLLLLSNSDLEAGSTVAKEWNAT